MSTAWELRGRLARREIRAVQVVEETLARIEGLNPTLRAFLSVFPDEARARAREIDEALDRGEDPGPLAGLPVALKDNICTRGQPTTCASRMLENFRPPYDATVVRRLRQAGAVLVGKTNLDEFAMGSSTENSAFFPTRNPWDPERVPGGSSGGSAAAVAAGMVALALGSDTGGSIRQPAAFCGVTGLKPTYGRVSRYGLVAFASSLDQIGCLTRDVRDCALLLGVIAGHDPLDSTSLPVPVDDYLAACGPGVEGMRLGVARHLLAELDPAMAESFEDSCRVLEGLGATLVEVELPHMQYGLPTYYVLAPAEASSNLARYDGVRYGYRAAGAPDVMAMFKQTRRQGFGAEVKRRIMLGTYALSSGYYDAYYLKAQKARTVLKGDFDAAFTRCHALLSPTTPTCAFRLGEKADPLQMYLSDIYTVGVNLAGLPALVVPGRPVQGLPVGLQIIGRPLDEARLLTIGAAFQEATDYHLRRPPLA